MEVPFAADTFTSVVEGHLDVENSFRSHEEADSAFKTAARKLAFGPHNYGLAKNKKRNIYWLRRYRCTLHGEKNNRGKVDGLDPKKQREKRNTKCDCPFRAHAKLDFDTGVWRIETTERQYPLIIII